MLFDTKRSVPPFMKASDAIDFDWVPKSVVYENLWMVLVGFLVFYGPQSDKKNMALLKECENVLVCGSINMPPLRGADDETTAFSKTQSTLCAPRA